MQAVLGDVSGPRKELHDFDGRVAVVADGALGIG
jgi:hypothetical protein